MKIVPVNVPHPSIGSRILGVNSGTLLPLLVLGSVGEIEFKVFLAGVGAVTAFTYWIVAGRFSGMKFRW